MATSIVKIVQHLIYHHSINCKTVCICNRKLVGANRGSRKRSGTSRKITRGARKLILLRAFQIARKRRGKRKRLFCSSLTILLQSPSKKKIYLRYLFKVLIINVIKKNSFPVDQFHEGSTYRRGRGCPFSTLVYFCSDDVCFSSVPGEYQNFTRSA